MPTPSKAETSGKARLGFMEVLKKIRAAQQARGYQGRSIEEMRADEARLESEEEEYERRFPDFPAESLR